MPSLQGKAALVLGCGGDGNIGRAIARRLRAEGAHVMVTARSKERVAAFAEEIGASAAACDITHRESVAALADEALREFGKIDIAAQSTGEGYLEKFLDNSAEDIDRIVRLQFIGPIYFFQTMIAAMKNGGSIITLSSVTAKIVINDHAVYQGTKAGIDQIVRCLAAEFGSRGIRVNAVAPGPTPTPMMVGLETLLDRAAQRSPMRRLARTDEIASAVAYLASDDCFITGEVLQANGGYGLVGSPVEGR
jgi:NAD(P)-dependent dehydrogenase (short-subunit alcohol dehydrogenase family)